MQIQPSLLSQLNPSKSEGNEKLEQPGETGRNNEVTNFLQATQVNLSDEGKMAQAMDRLSSQIDDILKKHLSPEQQKEIEGIYQQLDGLEQKGNLSLKEEEKAFRLEEKMHSILETSFDKLSGEDKQKVDGLLKQMEALEPVFSFAKED